jgi:hypothetical protein
MLITMHWVKSLRVKLPMKQQKKGIKVSGGKIWKTTQSKGTTF